MSEGIPGNKVKSTNSITQAEHEDAADAKRVVNVDANGDFIDEDNPTSSLVTFFRNGVPQQVIEDTVDPSNNRPLPVKLTGVQGDVIIEATNLNLQTQTEGEYDAIENPKPDSIGLVAHERSAVTDRTKQTRRVTAKRGTSDTDTVSQDVALHDHDGNKFSETNQFPTNSSIRDGADPSRKATVDSSGDLHVTDRSTRTFSTGTNTRPSVTNVSSTILASNSGRQYAYVFNQSGNVCWLKLGAAAVVNQGIRLPNNAMYEITMDNLFTGDVNAIFNVAGPNNLEVFEGP